MSTVRRGHGAEPHKGRAELSLDRCQRSLGPCAERRMAPKAAGVGTQTPPCRAVLIFVLILALVVAPIRPAQAFLAPLAAPYLVTAAGTSPMTIAGAAALAAAGTAVLGILFKDSSGNDALDVKINPKAPERVPSGWSAPPTAGDAPIPPSTASGVPTYSATFGGGTCTAQASIQACFEQMVPGFNQGLCGGVAPLYAYTYSAPTMSVTRSYPGHSPPGTCGSGGYSSGTVTEGTACPTGYSLSGGTCNLTDAPSVPFPSDNIGRKDCSSGTCGNNTRDPDSTNPAGVTGGPTQVKVKSGSSTTTVTVNGDGTISIRTVTPNGDGTSTGTEIRVAAPNPSAPDGGTNATGVEQGQVPGEGDLAGDPIPSNCGGGPCATESTQQQVRAGVEAVRDALKTDTITAAEKNLDAPKAALTGAGDAHIAQYSAATGVSDLGLGLSITWPSASCANPALTLPRGLGTLSPAMCERRPELQAIFKWFLGIFTAVVLFNIAIGAVRKD